jgi:hypothetical protein
MNLSSEFYDNKRIGRLIAWGGDHFVYEYGTDKVIKFSLIELVLGRQGWKKTMDDYLICKMFFGQYVLETDVMKSANSRWSGAVQPKIFGHYLCKTDFKKSHVKQQFLEIVKGYNDLISAGYPEVDLVGHGILTGRVMSNIYVDPEGKLFLFDTTLIDFKKTGILKPFFHFIHFFTYRIQRYLIKYFLDHAKS